MLRRASALTWVLALLAAAGVATAVLKARGQAWYAVDRPATPRALADEFFADVRSASAAPAAAISADGTTPFTEVAEAVGLTFLHDHALRGKYFLPEEMGPGIGVLDYDGDGDQDLFIAGGGAIIDDGPGQTCRLLRNDDGRFTDVTEAAGAAVPGPAYGVACADYDNDGATDLYVTRLGPNVLLRNRGDGTFEDVSAAARIDDPGFGTSAAFLDYDVDGLLDLFVVNYVDWSIGKERPCYTTLGVRDYCSPVVYESPSRDVLYRNRGDGTFEDVTRAAGIGAEAGNGLAVLATDFDGDGGLDIYVANDQTAAVLWHNNRDGTFTNTAPLAGCAYDGRGVAIAGMGTASEDFDGDGDFDLLVTNIREQVNLVLENDGGLFSDVSQRMGMGAWSIPHTAFGVAVFDQDHDGGFDLFITNGEVNIGIRPPDPRNPYAQPDVFARLVDGRFVDQTSISGIDEIDSGRAAATVDYDNDGDLDLLVTNNGGPVRLYRNNADGGAWLMVDVRTAEGRTAIGARVAVEMDGRAQMREVRPQQSYLASGDPRVHFGLGEATRVDAVRIRWPDGRETVRRDVAVGQVLVIRDESGGGP